jgi:hypothetical protein
VQELPATVVATFTARDMVRTLLLNPLDKTGDPIQRLQQPRA